MVILAKKFLTKFTKIWNFIPNTVFSDRPNIKGLKIYGFFKDKENLYDWC